jgi:hypothetical protein
MVPPRYNATTAKSKVVFQVGGRVWGLGGREAGVVPFFRDLRLAIAEAPVRELLSSKKASKP